MNIRDLIRRLRDHAEAHYSVTQFDEEQQQWYSDLLQASDLLERLSAGYVMPDPAFTTTIDGYGDGSLFTADQLREAYAAGAAAQLSAEPTAWLARDRAEHLFIVLGDGPHDKFCSFPVYTKKELS